GPVARRILSLPAEWPRRSVSSPPPPGDQSPDRQDPAKRPDPGTAPEFRKARSIILLTSPWRRIGAAGITLGHLQIMGADGARALQFLGGDLAHDLARDTHHDRARGDTPALGDQG